MGFMPPPACTQAPTTPAATERGRNWLALGLLLAAWNAADDRMPRVARPAPLQGYERVSVRAWVRAGTREPTALEPRAPGRRVCGM